MNQEIFKNYRLYVVMDSSDYKDIGDFHSGLAKTLHTNKVCGYINTKGYETLLYEYDEVGDFCGSIACVRIDNLWGFISKHFDLIIPLKYVWVSQYNNGFIVKENFYSDYVVINNEGIEIYRGNDYEHCLKRVKSTDLIEQSTAIIKKEYIVPFSNKKTCAYYNSSGEKIIPYYDVECRDFSEGFVVIKVDYNDHKIFNEKGKQLKVHTCFSIDARNNYLEKIINKFKFRVSNKEEAGFSIIINNLYYFSKDKNELIRIIQDKKVKNLKI